MGTRIKEILCKERKTQVIQKNIVVRNPAQNGQQDKKQSYIRRETESIGVYPETRPLRSAALYKKRKKLQPFSSVAAKNTVGTRLCVYSPTVIPAAKKAHKTAHTAALRFLIAGEVRVFRHVHIFLIDVLDVLSYPVR